MGNCKIYKKNVETPFLHNTTQPISECSNKRPDIFFDLIKHVVIVEIDENQHKSYEELCDCSRINEIVNSIGGKSVIFIRYNPDTIRHNNKKITIELNDKLKLLIDTINNEIQKDYDIFCVKIVQLFYDSNDNEYQNKQELNITNMVCI
jgi:hypothetical protein